MNPSILMTGCSTGIGYAAAKILKDRGWHVFATARKADDVARLRAEGLDSLPLDVCDPQAIQEVLNTILAKTGGTLDALFNNAGYMQAGAIEDITLDTIREQFETNTFGPIALTQAVIPIMRQQGHGRIVQNCSILGVVAMPFYGAYNGSKFALTGMTNTLRQELHGSGIHVALICPGPITSDLRQTALQRYNKTLKDKKSIFSNHYKKMEKQYFNRQDEQSKLTSPPNIVVDQLIHALESKRPKPRYYSGRPAKLMALLNWLLPERWLDAFIIKISQED